MQNMKKGLELRSTALIDNDLLLDGGLIANNINLWETNSKAWRWPYSNS